MCCATSCSSAQVHVKQAALLDVQCKVPCTKQAGCSLTDSKGSMQGNHTQAQSCKQAWQDQNGQTLIRPCCRALLLTGDYFLGGVVAGALTKLLLRLRKSTNVDSKEVNKLTAEAMLYIVSILRLGESQAALHPRDDDAVDRMVTCLKVGVYCFSIHVQLMCTAKTMLCIASILRLGESQAALHPRDEDAVDKMVTGFKVGCCLPCTACSVDAPG